MNYKKLRKELKAIEKFCKEHKDNKEVIQTNYQIEQHNLFRNKINVKQAKSILKEAEENLRVSKLRIEEWKKQKKLLKK